MSKLLNGKQVTCKPDGTVSFDRKVATCFLDGEDIALRHRTLNLDRALDRINGTAKFCKGAIAGILEDPPAKLLGLGIEKLRTEGLEPRKGSGLFRFHHSRVANDIGREDRRHVSLGWGTPRRARVPPIDDRDGLRRA